MDRPCGDAVVPPAPEAALTLDDADTAALYFWADALLFTSTQEGFGLPMLEAGLAGLPIFCSDLPVLREVAGPHASYFPVDAPPAGIADHSWRCWMRPVPRRCAAGCASSIRGKGFMSGGIQTIDRLMCRWGMSCVWYP